MKDLRQKPIIGINTDDSFSSVTISQSYYNAILENGDIPLLLPCIPNEDTLLDFVKNIDGMLFTGGADYPSSFYDDEKELSKTKKKFYGIEMSLKRAYTDNVLMDIVLNETDIPILGICAGHQLIGIRTGAKLIQDLTTSNLHEQKYVYGEYRSNGKYSSTYSYNTKKDNSHMVTIQKNSKLNSIFKAGLEIVNSSHHQAIDEKTLSSDFLVSVRSTKDNVIEAIEYKGKRFIIGVQWHPERIDDDFHRKQLFSTFINNARNVIWKK